MTPTVSSLLASSTTITGDSVASPGAQVAPLDDWQINVCVLDRTTGALLTREAVTCDDLEPVIREFWWHGFARNGFASFPFERVNVWLEPVRAKAKDKEAASTAESTAPGGITGYVLSSALPSGRPVSRTFSNASISGAVQRGIERLIALGRLQAREVVHFEIDIRRGRLARPDHRAAADGVLAGMQTRVRNPQLNWLTIPIKQLLVQAQVVGTHDDAHGYVFYTKAARQKAEQLSRAGMKQSPAIETGAALIGTLCQCPDSRDLYTVVTDALPVTDANATAMSLQFNSNTWDRITNVIHAMQRRPATRTWRLLGQAHGHPFLPANGAPMCEHCHALPRCTRTSVAPSSEDHSFMTAIWGAEPFGLSHIFGLSARHMRPNPDLVDGLFAMSDGRLLERGFHVVDRFDPAIWPQGEQASGSD